MHYSTGVDLSIYHVFLMKQGIPGSSGVGQGARSTRRLPAHDPGLPIIHWNPLGICWISVIWLATQTGALFTQYDIQFAILPGRFSSKVTYGLYVFRMLIHHTYKGYPSALHEKGNTLRMEIFGKSCT
jgi:hypothetical protein